jgi:serine/threonine-protein kinase HipA
MAGRRPSAQALAIWMNGLRVGEWRIPSRGRMELAYDPIWLQSEQARPLSLSLPLPLDPVPLRGNVVAAWFDNLLPGFEPLRRRIAARLRLPGTEPFTLLSEIGRDCVGAVQLLPVDAPRPKVDTIVGDALDEAGIVHALDLAATTGDAWNELDEPDELRISLAGAQDKTALLWHGERWCRPRGATPTTHILKLPSGLIGGQRGVDFTASVDNEWLCLRILGLFGLPVPNASIETFGPHRVLVVERFDRRLAPSGHWWQRLPQEDFCQVHGLSPTAKYERDGGPGIVEIANCLRASEQPGVDIERFVMAQVLFWMLAAIDGHAKNFSIFLLPQGRFRLTPFYDVLSAWPVAGPAPSQIDMHDAKLAMSLRGRSRHRKILDIRRRHFESTAQLCGLASAEPLLERVLAVTPAVLDAAQRDIPEGLSQRVLDRVLEGFASMARRLAAMPCGA